MAQSQFGFNNDLGLALSRGLNLGEQFRAGQQRRTQEGLQQQFFQGGGLEAPDALQQAGKIGAEFQQQVAGQLGLIDKQTRQIKQDKLCGCMKGPLKSIPITLVP